MFIEFKPTDPLFFRDSRPFDMGIDNFGSSIPIPRLTTLHGALVSYYIKTVRPMNFEYKELAKEIKFEIPMIKIRSLKENKDIGYFLPAPSDLVQTDYEEPFYFMTSLRLIEETNVFSSSPFAHYLVSESKNKQKDGIFYVSLEEMKKYLKGEKSVKAVNLQDIIVSEPKLGIAIDSKTRRTKDEHLYQQIHRRYENKDYEISFIIKTTMSERIKSNFPKKGFARLGGEGRLAKISQIDNIPELEELCSIKLNNSGISKLYFATSFPSEWNLKRLDAIDHNKILTASIPKAELISGFDMVKREQKKTKVAVPQGSVYYFKEINLSDYHGKAFPNDCDYQGYGRVFVGIYKE